MKTPLNKPATLSTAAGMPLDLYIVNFPQSPISEKRVAG